MIEANRTVLVTGAAGFIGAALVPKLLENGEKVVGIDNLNSYYDPSLKKSRLDEIKKASASLKALGVFTRHQLKIVIL